MPNNNVPNNKSDIMPQVSTYALINKAVKFTQGLRLQFIVPETLLYILLADDDFGLFKMLKEEFGIDTTPVKLELFNYLNSLERVPLAQKYRPRPSAAYEQLAEDISQNTGGVTLGDVLPVHFFVGLCHLEGSLAKHLLDKYVPNAKRKDVFRRFGEICESKSEDFSLPSDLSPQDLWDAPAPGANAYPNAPLDSWEPATGDDACSRIDSEPAYVEAKFAGRELEINRSIVSLLKARRGHIVYVGEPGVGKTTMVTGLIQAKERYKKKSRFGGARFYKFNPAAIVTGVSYADEIENHVADIVADIEDEHCMAVLFADNLGELMPQNQNDNTPDTLRLLLSLTSGKDIHIVTTASFEQYKRFASHNSVVEKNFTRIDIAEPPLEPDGRLMVKAGAQNLFEAHPQVDSDCPPEVLELIINTATSSYSKDIAMPGRALDLLDGALAFTEKERSIKRSSAPAAISVNAVNGYLKTLGYDSIAHSGGGEDELRSLEPHILAKIFGQDEAVHGVAESVLLAKAGLSDDTKPLAAYLFVGPTGVGKTELAKVLAAELGTKLVRFDMSEYSERHTVSRLVGSPAGYIGYEDGGLLTDAVRKSPNCVLLFDEIEKAHSAVFNLLLQVLDYAQLTDNRGQKADFSGTIIIMTSNAGARFASGRGLGFGSNQEKSQVMGAELKRVFAPEFLNRLTQIVAFHDMSQAMAERILDRKVADLNAQLAKKKKVSFSLTPEARKTLLTAGFSSIYGAREMDRAIGSLLKPALMQALLFGARRQGGDLVVKNADGGKLVAE